MSRKVKNEKEAYIKEELIEKILQVKNWRYDDLLYRLKSDYGLDIGYKALSKLMKNTVNWRLTYAFVLCDLLELRIDELFQLEPNRSSERE